MAESFRHVSKGNARKQRKREDMKSKPHKNNSGPAKSSQELVLREQIEKRAHEIWLAAGCPHGEDLTHWLQAEREALKGRGPTRIKSLVGP
jgi:hypothetical protein